MSEENQEGPAEPDDRGTGGTVSEGGSDMAFDSSIETQPGVKDDPLQGQKEVGGIDFHPDRLKLQIKRDAQGIPLPVHMQPIQEMNIEGFFPVIINIAPVNIPLLLGLNPAEEGIPSRKEIPALSYKRVDPLWKPN